MATERMSEKFIVNIETKSGNSNSDTVIQQRGNEWNQPSGQLKTVIGLLHIIKEEGLSYCNILYC